MAHAPALDDHQEFKTVAARVRMKALVRIVAQLGRSSSGLP
jgi:hypothetical protein